MLLAAGADANASHIEGFTPLMLAADRRDEIGLAMLIQAGASPTAQSICGATALSQACKANWIRGTSLLLKQSVGVNSYVDYGLTPLLLACTYGHSELAEHLCECGADVNLPSKPDLDRHFRGVPKPAHLDWLSRTNSIDKKLQANQSVRETWSADLFCSVSMGRGTTPLMVAAKNGQIEIVEHLLARGANVNARNGQDKSALFFSLTDGSCSAIVDCLLRAEAYTSGCLAGGTALHDLIAENDMGWDGEDFLATLRTLLVAGVNPKTVDDKGRLPLHLIKECCDTEQVDVQFYSECIDLLRRGP